MDSSWGPVVPQDTVVEHQIVSEVEYGMVLVVSIWSAHVPFGKNLVWLQFIDMKRDLKLALDNYDTGKVSDTTVDRMTDKWSGGKGVLALTGVMIHVTIISD